MTDTLESKLWSMQVEITRVYNEAIEDRLRALMKAGIARHRISIRWGYPETIIFLDNQADSKFSVKTEGTIITVEGVSMR